MGVKTEHQGITRSKPGKVHGVIHGRPSGPAEECVGHFVGNVERTKFLNQELKIAQVLFLRWWF